MAAIYDGISFDVAERAEVEVAVMPASAFRRFGFRVNSTASFGDNGVMTKTLQAVYENGLLRPLEPLPLKEHQRVTVTVSDPAEGWLDHEYMEKVKRDSAEMGPAPSLEEIRAALSKIPGKLYDDIRAERESR